MRVRRMQPADVARIAAIERECFSQPWSEKSFADALSDSNALFLVAEAHTEDGAADGEKTVAGYIGMYLSPPEGQIANVAVAKAYRNAGCAAALLSAVQNLTPAYGIEEIFLEVRMSNAPAIHVYGKAGFREVGVRRGFYDFPREDAKIMQWIRKEDLC